MDSTLKNNSLDRFISYTKGAWLDFIISERNAKIVDPDQTAASDLGLHCLPMSLFWEARLKCVNVWRAFQAIFM